MDGTFVSVHPPASHAGCVPNLYGLALPGAPVPLFVPQIGPPPPVMGPSMDSTKLDSEFELKCIPCPHHFGKRGEPCRYGDGCLFSHEPAVMMAARRLRPCPNTGCSNLCQGRQCKECHVRMMQRRRHAKQHQKGKPAA